MLQMLLNQNGSFKRASGEIALRIAIRILRWSTFLLFDANEHLGEKKALKLLPRLPVFAHSNCAIESELPEPILNQ